MLTHKNTSMIHEFQKTVDGLMSIVCTFLFAAFSIASVNAIISLISGVCAIGASIIAMVYYWKQLKANNHIKKKK
jgi:hypothetical protein